VSLSPGNLFDPLPRLESGEAFQTLLRRSGIHIERIVSSPRPEPVLYEQAWDEWVILLAGEARLDFDGESLHLRAGDHLLIPAGLPHRVLSASDDPRCLWLAVHLHGGAEQPEHAG
jgi:cupin 2 domain-containing protein